MLSEKFVKTWHLWKRIHHLWNRVKCDCVHNNVSTLTIKLTLLTSDDEEYYSLHRDGDIFLDFSAKSRSKEKIEDEICTALLGEVSTSLEAFLANSIEWFGQDSTEFSSIIPLYNEYRDLKNEYYTLAH